MDFNLKGKFVVASIFFFINGVIGNYSPSIALVKDETTNSKIDLNIDYFDNLPNNDYILGPGDTVTIRISRDYPELSTSSSIDGEGTIYLPRLNRVYISGLTLNELNLLLDKAFRKFVKYPDVEVEIADYRPIRVLVKGEVENPGLQTLPGSLSVTLPPDDPFDLNPSPEIVSDNIGIDAASKGEQKIFFPTVFDALRQSGGITHFTDLTDIKIIRSNNLSNGGGKIQTTLNFEDVLIKGDTFQNIRVYDSDIIIVNKSDTPNKLILRKAILSNLNPKFISVFVTGRVNRPGNTTVSKASVLSDAVDIAGGAKVLRGPVTFLRFQNDGNIDKRKFTFSKKTKRGSYRNPYLKNGDLIVIDNSAISNINEILTEFTSPFVGIFQPMGL